MHVWLTRRMLAAHALALVGLLIAGGLGLWQLDAWSAHRANEARDLSEQEPLALQDVLGPDDVYPGDRVGQPVRASGVWVPSGTVFVADRDHDGARGYWVVTPVSVETPGDPAIAVVRGWVATLDDVPAAPSGAAEIDGWLQPSEGTGVIDDDPTDDVLPQLRMADLAQRVDVDLYGGYVVARTPGAGLEAADLEALPPVSRTTGLRNLLYGVEWWFFAAFVLFVWWRFTREERRPSRRPAEQPGEPDPADV
ncbi:SURF1 family protein [Nocardioides sp. R-C-SC26]|uniref:SURF1 family protein n=1 Tax=Nocardioides sp. R-C-SC26 TaxID=2870414 RepID=UPI001E3972A4|nr:SURF1 family protein [Nocardioides sp. R-C-SC26]